MSEGETPILSMTDVNISVPSGGQRELAVQGLSLTIRPGETLGLVGESGSGKSLSALSVMGLLPAPGVRLETGQIKVAGHDISQMTSRKLRTLRGPVISMIFQEPMTSLNPAFTVGDQIGEVLRRHKGMNRKSSMRRAAELLDRVGIADASRRVKDYPHAFSGGMRQRVMIAIAIACEPQLLLADEPTTALDVTVQRQILELLGELKAQMSMSMMFVTHDLAVIAEIADRVAVMYAGQIVEQGSVRSLIDRPLHPYLEGLLGAVPQLDRRVARLSEIVGSIPLPGMAPAGCLFHPRCPYVSEPLCTTNPIEMAPRDDHEVRCARHADLSLRGAP